MTPQHSKVDIDRKASIKMTTFDQGCSALRNLTIFESLGASTLNTLLQHCPIQEIAKGDVLISKGQLNSSLYLVLSGCLSVHIQSISDSPITKTGIGEVVGELSYIDSAPVTAFVMAQTDSRILVINREFVLKSPSLADAISKYLLKTITNRCRHARELIYQDREELRKNLKTIASSQRELAEKSELLARTLKMMSQGICVFDANLRLVDYNQRFLELLELPEELVHVDSRFEDIIRYNAKRDEYGDKDVDETVSQCVKRAKRFEPHHFICERPDGTVIRVQENPVPEGGWYTTYTNITKEVRAKKEAERDNQAKSELLAKVSHEMPTPLNPIINYAKLMRQKGNLTAKQKRDLHDIELVGKALLNHVSKLLDWSKIEARKMELFNVDFDLVELIQGVSSLFKTSAEAKGLQFRLENECGKRMYVHGDKGKLRNILNNLLDNAVKFTEKGEIRLRVSIPQKDWYHIEVIDSGKGIPLEAQKNLFHPYQMSEAGVEIGGWGLGLHLTKKKIKLMGGSLQLDSAPNTGSCFSFRISFLAALSSVEKRAPRDLQPICLKAGTKVLALVVDDDPTNLRLLCEILSKAGVSTLQATSGQEALQILQETESNINIIFVDIQMPVMNGYQTLQAIKKEIGKAQPKVVAISATSELSTAHYIVEGFDDFISKPFERFALVYNCVHRLLGVEFEYDEPRTFSPNETTSISKSQDLILPKFILKPLKKAAHLGRIDEVMDYLKELEGLGPAYNMLAGYFRIYALKFDLSGLLHEVENFRESPQ